MPEPTPDPELVALRLENERLRNELTAVTKEIAGVIVRFLERCPEFDEERPN